MNNGDYKSENEMRDQHLHLNGIYWRVKGFNPLFCGRRELFSEKFLITIQCHRTITGVVGKWFPSPEDFKGENSERRY